MIQVIARAPTRVDLGGGTLDMTMLHQILDYKMTVNVAVSVDAEVEIVESHNGNFEIISEDQGVRLGGHFREIIENQKLPLFGLLLKNLWKEEFPPLRIMTRAQSPAGAGMGGSSCLGIAFAGALGKARSLVDSFRFQDEYALVEFVKDIETYLIKVPTGCQDYWGGLRGGINLISFPPGGVEVDTLNDIGMIEALSRRMILCYSGKSRASATNNWQIFKRAFDGEKLVLEKLNKIGFVANKIAEALRKNQLESALAFSHEEWNLRKELWPDIVTEETTNLELAALKSGADFARVCGAGGGGVMAIFAPQGKRSEVITALQASGGVILSGAPTLIGLRVN